MKYFALLIVGVLSFLSCSDSTTVNPLESTSQNSIKPVVKMTVYGKIKFSDGTIYESWDKPKSFTLPEKYIGKVEQQKKMAKASEVSYSWTLFKDGYMTVYGKVEFNYWFGVEWGTYSYITVSASTFAYGGTIASNANIINNLGGSVDKREDWSNVVDIPDLGGYVFTNPLLMTEGSLNFSSFYGSIRIDASSVSYGWSHVAELNYHLAAANFVYGY